MELFVIQQGLGSLSAEGTAGGQGSESSCCTLTSCAVCVQSASVMHARSSDTLACAMNSIGVFLMITFSWFL